MGISRIDRARSTRIAASSCVPDSVSFGRHNEPLVIHSDVQLPPIPAFLRCLGLVRVPFAATQNLEPFGINDQINRAIVGSGQGWHHNDLLSARECDVVRGLEVAAHPNEQRVQKPLRLAKRQVEDDPHCQRGLDREVRVSTLPSAETVLRWYPHGNRILAQPDRDLTVAPETTLVLPSVPYSVLRLVLAVDSARLSCDHDVAP